MSEPPIDPSSTELSVKALAEAGATPSELAAEKQRATGSLAGFDALHPLALVASLALYPAPSNSGIPPIDSAQVEYLATILLERPSREAVDPQSAGTRPPALYEVREATESALARIRRIIGRSAYRAMAESVAAKTPQEQLSADHRHREVLWRWNAYPDQESDLAAEILCDGTFDATLTDELGFGASEAYELQRAIATALGIALRMNEERSEQAYEDAMSAERRSQLDATDDPAGTDRALRRAMTMGPELVPCMSVSAKLLAELSGTSEDAARSFLSCFSCEFGSTSGTAGMSGSSAIRQAPLIALEDGAFMVTSFSNLSHAIRPRLEGALAESPCADAFQAGRAAAIEERARAAIARALGPRARVYSNLAYDLPAGKNYEVDLLAVIDDLALVVEVKAGTFGEQARRGKRAALRKKIETVLAGGIEQSNRLVTALEEGVPVEFRERSSGEPVEIDPARLDRVKGVVVTLEDLGWLASRRRALRELGALPGDAATPWVVSVFDLDLICRMCSSPAELTRFVGLRGNLDPRVLPYDELEVWLTYLTESLDFSQVSGGPIFLEGRIGAVDDALLRSEGQLPSMGHPKATRREFRALAKKQRPGWLRTCEELIAETQAQRAPEAVDGVPGMRVCSPPGHGIVRALAEKGALPLPQVRDE